MFLFDPGPCPICGAAHHGCRGARDDSTGVGTTRGVIVRQAPQKDALQEAPPAPAPASAPAERDRETSNRAERR